MAATPLLARAEDSGANAAGEGAATMSAAPEVLHLPISDLGKLPAEPILVELERPEKIPSKHDVGRIGERGVGHGFNLYSRENERQWGARLANEIEGNMHLLKDPVVTEFINRVGQNLARHSDSGMPFTIKVIDDDEINAIALPGGFLYVNTGLILAAENEAELAGVMAHEIAHVAARHASKSATRSEIMNLVSIPLMFVGGPAGFAVRQVWGLAVPMSVFKFSRGAEREADLLGLQYQYATGYDPHEFVRFFEKLHMTEKKKKGLLARAFSTHPMTGDRIRRAEEEITKWLPAEEQYVVDTSDFEAVKARLVELMGMRRIDVGKSPQPILRKRKTGD